MANEEQIERWSGKGGEHWASEQERYDRTLAPYTDHLVRAIATSPGEQLLDVGCGNGAVSLALASVVAPNGGVVGVDISTPMLARARERASAAGLDGLTFLEADAQTHHFDPVFDGIVSRFGVMFFDDPTAALTNLAAALRPGGRLAFACWRDLLLNDWMTVPLAAALQHVPMPPTAAGAPGPFAFADADRVRRHLEAAGFIDVGIEEVDELEWVGDGPDDALGFFQRSGMADTLLADVDQDTLEQVWDSVREAIAPHATPDGVFLGSAAWLVTATRP